MSERLTDEEIDELLWLRSLPPGAWSSKQVETHERPVNRVLLHGLIEIRERRAADRTPTPPRLTEEQRVRVAEIRGFADDPMNFATQNHRSQLSDLLEIIDSLTGGKP